MKNKLISIALAIIITLSAFPFPERGEAAGYGLTLNISNTKLNGRIALGDGCVYVYSHISPSQNEYKVSSKALVESLYSEDYDVAYTNSDKSPVSVSNVEDGYIRLTSASETVYVPVKSNSETIWSEDFQSFSSSDYYKRRDDGVIATTGLVNGFKGRDKNDVSFYIDGNGDSDIYPCGEGLETYLQKNNVLSSVDTVATIEFSFCNESTGSAHFNAKFKSLADFFKVESDGDVYIDNEYKGTIAPGEWHKVSVALDFTRNRLLVFVDGIYLAEPYVTLSNTLFDHFKLSIRGEYDSDGNAVPIYGSIVYDDVEIYGGYPRNLSSKVSGLYSDKLIVDNENRVIYGAVGKTADAVAEAINAELDGEFSVSDDVINEASTLTLEVTDNWNQTKSAEYSFSDKTYASPLMILNTGEGTQDNITIVFDAVGGSGSDTEDSLFAVGVYKGNELTSVIFEYSDISEKKNFELSVCLDREEKERIKFFFWDSELRPLLGEDITSETARTTVFSNDYKYETLMSDFVSVHSRSGLLTYHGKKALLKNKPFTKDSVLYIAPEEISGYLGVSCTVNGSVVNVGANSFVADSDNFKNGVAYIPAQVYFQNLLSMTTSTFNYEYNGGVIIAGDRKLIIPEGMSEKQLNSYLYNLRPSKNDIKYMYNSSPLKGEHPRIYIDSGDLTRIKSEIETNEYKKKWANTIISAANWDIKQPIVSYVIDDGGRLLGVSRKVLQYMHTLGMAYFLTGEQKYADRAYLHLEAASAFPDWNPDHSLDTGEMCAAFAVGYDWMYDAFTPAQRKTIEEGFLKNGISAANNLYEGVSGRTGSVYAESNWNAVVNGGIATGALAFYDAYPENCSQLLSNAVRGYEHILWRFAPDGGWYEGPGYWEYTIKYTSKMLSNTKRILGTDFAFPLCEGFDKTVDYALAIQSSNGTFSYGDCMKGKYLVPEMFWISNTLSKPEYTRTLLNLSDGGISDWEDLVLGLCWYDVNIFEDDVFLPLDNYIRKEEVVSMRSGWGTEDSFFAAAAGTNGGSHDHLDSGGFVFDTGGVRWAIDSGQGNYNNPRYSYWDEGEDGDRWKIFCIRAEAHSTLVINPTTAPDQKLGSYTEVVRINSGENESLLELDMTDALSANASSAKRAFALTDSKQSLVIRDEIVLSDSSKNNEIYWLMITDADVSVSDAGAVLTKDGKTLYLKFSSDSDAVISCEKAKSFDETGVIDDEYGGIDLNRIAIKMTATQKTNLTVSLSQTDGTYLLDSYDKSISEWNED